MNIILGISSSIAAYKAINILRSLSQAGANIQCVLTKNAHNFVSPLVLQSLSKNKVLSELFDLDQEHEINHIKLAQSADYILLAPASANLIAKLAHGIADDLLSTLYLASKAKKIIAPAMNANMWENEITQENIKKLAQRGAIIIQPESGWLACETIGSGRLAAIENILAPIQTARPLKNLTALVTLGATIQPLDPFRFISNHSSGKMGYYLALALQLYGAKVTVISGLTQGIAPIIGANHHKIKTTSELAKSFKTHAENKDIIIMAAAVSDFEASYTKIKMKGDNLKLELNKSIDIIKSFKPKNRKKVTKVAFAAESNITKVEVQRKFNEKDLDLLVVNQINQKNPVFGVEENKASLKGADFYEPLPLLHKKELAKLIVEKIIKLRGIDNQ